jgi:hypothetical protein
MTKRKPLICVLCGGAISKDETFSTYHVEGDIKGFVRHLDVRQAFHNACLTRDEGVNEIARARVLDYLEAAAFNTSVLEDLKNQNLERARKLVREMKWRAKYGDPKA